MAHVSEMAGFRSYDPFHDPPPDLALEVEVSSSIMNRLGIYAAMGIPEVWRYTRRGRIVFMVLRAGAYEEAARSPLFPWPDPADLLRHLEGRKSSRNKFRDFRAWIRSRQK